MSEQDARLDARMRGLLSRGDTSADFDLRVMQRIAALGSTPAVDLRAQFERKRELARRRLRREAWSNVVTIAGIGAAAGVVVWRHAPAIMQWAQSGGISDINPWFFAGIVITVLVGSLWPLLRRLPTPL
jgi:hypothetical protein